MDGGMEGWRVGGLVDWGGVLAEKFKLVVYGFEGEGRGGRHRGRGGGG